MKNLNLLGLSPIVGPQSYHHRIITIKHETYFQIFSVFITNAVILTLNLSSPQQVAHSTCADSEYNLRSRTVVCGSCGLPSDKSSNCSVTSASRSGGISEGLLPHSYVFSASTPRKVGAATLYTLQLIHDLLKSNNLSFSRRSKCLFELICA